jgi:glycosyltransferase involved in cell wall biosynthesis
MKEPRVSVIIPAFNEENCIRDILLETLEVLAKTGLSYEIIVVDDGSRDETVKVAKEYNVVVVENGVNLGKGAALKAGFLKATGDLIITMDADGSHKPKDLLTLISPLLKDHVDMTLGSRFNSEIGRNSTSKVHFVGNKIINMVILFLTGNYISDSQSGFRAYKRVAIKKLSLYSLRYEIETEIIVKMLRKGFRIKEVPINCEKRMHGYSKINGFNDGFKILKTILKAMFSD